MINLNSGNDDDADVLIDNVASQYKPIFFRQNYSAEQKRGVYRYFFSQKPKKLPPSLRNRIINLYDPLADRTKRFPDGLRFCLNVYVGCEHACGYCYVNGYSKHAVSFSPHTKQGFKEKLVKDIKDIEYLQLPVAPLHLSNSTDICQQNLESSHKHTLLSLQQIHQNRRLFSSIVLLTKNPAILCQDEYLSLLKEESMRPVTVQISCAFWRDEIRKFFEPHAPEIQNRLDAFRELCDHGINVDLRIDPLFPSSDFEPDIRKHLNLNDYNLPEPQTNDDLVRLVEFVKEAGGKAIIAKPLKIPVSNKAKQAKEWFVNIYKDANHIGGTGKVKGGSYRLPDEYQKAMMMRVKKMCDREGVVFRYCKHDVLRRK
ncbi:MAG: hypothetical protein ACUZ8O_12085 [Candidatus Anammoxibacter sp.]